MFEKNTQIQASLGMYSMSPMYTVSHSTSVGSCLRTVQQVTCAR